MKNLQITNILITIYFVVLAQNVQAQNWRSSGGVSGTTAGIWLGTNTPGPLDIRTNSFTRMYITSAATGLAKIGINTGTATPAATLYINGNSGNVGDRNFTVRYSLGGNLSNTEFSALAHLVPQLGGNGWTAMYAKSGTAEAAGYFDGKVVMANGTVMLTGTNTAGGPMILFSDNTTNYPNGRWGIEYEPNQHGLNFWEPFGNPGSTTAGNFYLFLKDDGKIGMGIDPTTVGCTSFGGNFRLYVKDGILTEKVKVAGYCAGNWPDFVFEPGYKLKPLNEVASFIMQNKHLPGIPASGDIEKDGMDLADMLSLQMAKIEELTLHLIELNKRLEKLEAENSELKLKNAFIEH